MSAHQAAVLDTLAPQLEPWLRDFLHASAITSLTDIQRKAVDAGILDEKSMIVCSPTSSGKTLVAEMALLSAARRGRRTVYLVSHRALAEQKYTEFTSRFGEGAAHPVASIGLSTGDRSDGPTNAQVLVATYEKALGLVLTGEIRPPGSLIVADELQIIGEPSRGPDIEVLLTLLRQRAPAQFVALTATIANPEVLANWLGCIVVRSTDRVVPLHQEIWAGTRRFSATFGEANIEEGPVGPALRDVHAAVRSLLDAGRGPTLVFIETRREAAELAREFGASRQVTAEGVVVSAQLDLFTEPTDSSELLRAGAERRVAFHSADLSTHERQIVEAGFARNHFEVCFATSTLAAGVNFPFRSVVFPKLTYQFRDGQRLARSDYRNMSGRAGRLGLHPDGFAVLLPANALELEHAKMLVRPEEDSITSQIGNVSIRKTVLSIVASRVVASSQEAVAFFESTLLYSQRAGSFANLPQLIDKALIWLIEKRLISDSGGGALVSTRLGKAVAQTGLLPDTAVRFADLLRGSAVELERSFDQRSRGLIYAVCACEEFRGESSTRFLPYARRQSYESIAYWRSVAPWVRVDDTDTQLAQSAQATQLFAEGLSERQITRVTEISAGYIHRLAGDVSWVLDGVHKLSCVPELGCSQGVSNQLAALARRVRWGAPAEALDVIRIAERHRVPGLGRQRAMALLAAGIDTLHKVLETPTDKLTEVLQGPERAKALVEAIVKTDGLGRDSLQAQQRHVAERLGVGLLLDGCNSSTGIAYETAIGELLKRAATWDVERLDDGTRQNVPDLMIRLGRLSVLLECKTCTRNPQLIKKEEAWAVMQKAADYDAALSRVTLGKPAFDETSKKKAAAARDITLVEHAAFVEGLLRVVSGTVAPIDFLEWLTAPGVADIDRLGGTPTYSM